MKPPSSLKKSPVKASAELVVKDIRRATRRHFSAEDKIRIVLEALLDKGRTTVHHSQNVRQHLQHCRLR